MSSDFKQEFARIEAEYYSRTSDELTERISRTGAKLVIMGAGGFGNALAACLADKANRFVAFCDNNKKGINERFSVPIVTPRQIYKEHPDAIMLIVANKKHNDEMYKQLLTIGFDDKNIYRRYADYERYSIETLKNHYNDYAWAYDFFSDERSKQIVLDRIRQYLFFCEVDSEPLTDQYFDQAVQFTEEEVFIDGGCFTGDTTLEFIHRMNGKYKNIICFEPDRENYVAAKKNLAKYENIRLINKGLYDRDVEAPFDSQNNGGSKIVSCGTDIVSCTSLDAYLNTQPTDFAPTFIKLDIEGAELPALRGMQNIIRSARPKLAICVYHKPEDIYTIPRYILNLSDYNNLFLRHYSLGQCETVLYAV
jgi:FkbM family methyltransferase